ncbi:hypothetical protein SDJN02_20516, partial [Cucurbita argyrosperma subsp. argyrosperma]
MLEFVLNLRKVVQSMERETHSLPVKYNDLMLDLPGVSRNSHGLCKHPSSLYKHKCNWPSFEM